MSAPTLGNRGANFKMAFFTVDQLAFPTRKNQDSSLGPLIIALAKAENWRTRHGAKSRRPSARKNVVFTRQLLSPPQHRSVCDLRKP